MKKIMFNDKYGLTEAVLNSRKTMTRRFISEDVWQRADVYRHKYYEDTLGLLPGKKALISFSPFKVGEVVAVAQRYKDIRDIIGDIQDGKSIKSMAGWNNKMFVSADLMPHQIRITNVRVERLQDISDEDVYKEGFAKDTVNNGWGNYAHHWEAMLVYYDSIGRTREIRSPYPREAFATLIDKVSVIWTWQSNPWVFVYEFELVK
jgi:hypothetical protein